MAECLAGVLGASAAGAVLGKETFDYNRENFLGDRGQRLEKEFKSMDMSIEQVKQWREDVEDLVSLTEKKMHIYNLTTILLVLITIFLWCEVEDTLATTTPTWLICGFALANTGAFMFLMLSIWLAMHSAVVAQGYNVRLRTQMVRLPIPSWQEIEACRTYGSQFESMEGRQMFRVPFMMGRQEDLAAAAGPPLNSATAAAETSSQVPATSTEGPPASTSAQSNAGVEFADPWGLERRADKLKRLGCPLGAEVANLRHIKMTRQAATLWQTYDSFARVSLSIGINQLILAISYYFLAYLLVDVKCPVAGIVGVVVLMVLADAVLKLEISLKNWQLNVAQFFGVLGPVMGIMAAWHGEESTDLSTFVGRWCIPFAFLAHGIYLVFMIYLCKVKVQPNGARVPAAFKQALYLDAFGWMKADVEGATTTTSTQSRGAARQLPEKPAMFSVKYGDAGPCPTLPQDLAPYSHSDMRFEEGACDPGQRMPVGSKVKVPFYAWGFDGLYHDDDKSETIVTGHEAEAPGVWPWVIFHTGLSLLAAVWVAAAVWRLYEAMEFLDTVVSMDAANDASVNSTSLLAYSSPLHSMLQADSQLPEASLSHIFKIWASSYLGNLVADSPLELIQTSWAGINVSPRTLSCDASGRQLLVTDGLLSYTANLDRPEDVRSNRREPFVAAFGEMGCSALVGENVQDAAIICERGNAACQALILHRNGRRVASCGHASQTAALNATQISDSWLERDNASNIEKVTSVAVAPSCRRGLEHCTYVHTSHGQVVQLRRSARRKELVPADVLQEVEQVEDAKPQLAPGTVRAFNDRYLGVLQPKKQVVELLDTNNGGLRVGKLILPPTVHADTWCAGGGQLFLLSVVRQPQLWRMQLPRALSAD